MGKQRVNYYPIWHWYQSIGGKVDEDIVATWSFSGLPTATGLSDERSDGATRAIQPGRALSFDGVDDYVDTGMIWDSSWTSGTIACWIKTTDATAVINVITNYHTSAPKNTIALQLVVGKVRATLRDTNEVWTNVTGTTDVNDGEWHHIAVTHSSSGADVFVDGVLDETGANNGSDFNFDHGQTLRISGDGAGNRLDSDIRDVRVFSRKLDSDEVLSLAKGLAGQPLDSELHYLFEEGGGTTAYDSSGNGNDGTLLGGPTWVEDGQVDRSYANDVGYTDVGGVVVPRDDSDAAVDVTGSTLGYPGAVPRDAKFLASNCVHFDGVDDRIDTPIDKIDIGSVWTFACWFRSDVLQYATGIFEVSNSVGVAGWVFVQRDNQTIRFWANATYLATETGISDVTWHHVAFSFDGSDYRTYINGVKRSTVAGSAGATGGSALRIGSGYLNEFDGRISDFRCFDRALSDAEVLSVKEAADDQPTDPLLHYPLAEGFGTTVYDISGNGHDGTLIGGALWSSANDVYHHNITRGFTDSSGVRIPALMDGSLDATGGSITNPAVVGHNDAETQIDFTGGETDSPFANVAYHSFGAGEYVTVPGIDESLFSGGFTLSAWIYLDSTTSGVLFSIASGTNWNWLIASSSGLMRTQIQGGSTRNGGSMLVGEWAHYVWTYDEANVRHYVNGAEVYSVAETTAVPSNSVVRGIGGWTAGTQPFQGDVYDLQLFGRVLNAEDVSLHFRNGLTDLADYRWKLNDEHGSLICDSGLLGAHGTMTSGTRVWTTVPQDYSFGDSLPPWMSKSVDSAVRESQFKLRG